MKTLVSYQTPRARTRARRLDRVRRFVHASVAPSIFLACVALSSVSTLRFFTWLGIVQ